MSKTALALLGTIALLLPPHSAILAQDAIVEKPDVLTKGEIKRLTSDGDRLADQGDYLAALTKYTTAYMGVVSRVRGQDFLLPVKPTLFNREELAEEMLKLVKEEFTDEELLLMDSSYKVLGLMPPELDSKQLMTQLLTEEIAGFYDPDNKRMVLIVEDGPQEDPGWFGRLLGAKQAFDKDEQKLTLAHELTHALQDQLYDLNAMEKGIEDDDDMLLAFSAIVEGDATLLMFVEQGDQDITEMDPEVMRATFNIMSWMLPVAGGEAYRKAPPVFRESLIFPYFQGMLFVIAVAAQEGWPAIHASYAQPPVSTEQILHPEKFLDPEQLDTPQQVILPELDQAVSDDWQYLGGNCLGEFQTSILLKRVAGGSQAARGWDGDRYEVYSNRDGKLALVFVSVWDSQQDAEQFYQAYLDYRDQQGAEAQSVLAADCSAVDNSTGRSSVDHRRFRLSDRRRHSIAAQPLRV